jgi:DNA-binding transcriptional regulator YhcF (GntR family)
MLFGRSQGSGGSNAYNFSGEMRAALARSRDESIRLGHEYVGTEHIVLGLVHGDDDPATRLLAYLGVDRGDLRDRIASVVKTGRSRSTGDRPYTSRAKKVLELAMRAAREMGQNTVGADHLLLGVLNEEKGIGAQVLHSMGVTAERVVSAMRGEPASFTIRIDDKSELSIYEQIVAQVKEGIAVNALESGNRLPTVRRLADDLDIAPGTVARAYGELERLGLVITEGTRGTRVAPPAQARSRDPADLDT